MAALVGLGFASGLPLQLTGRTLTAWLSVEQVDVAAIGLLSLVAWPYALKFVWAPLMDRYALPGLGRRRGWLLLTQALVAAAMIAMAMVGPNAGQPGSLIALAAAALALACFSASQDIVADAYRTDILKPAELGAGAAVFVTGYRVALILAAGGAIAMAQWIGWRAVYLTLAACMGVGLAATILAPRPASEPVPPTLRDAIVEPFVQFTRRHRGRTILLLLVVVLFKLPDELARPMIMPLLLQHLRLEQAMVGLAESASLGLTIIGALLGGAVVARWGLVRSLALFGVLQALSNGGFWALSHQGGGMGLMFTVMGVESLCAGLVTAGFLAFLMSLCDQRYSAFQFALLTSLMALVRPMLGAPTGFLVERMGYDGFFAATILAGLPAMLLLPAVREPDRDVQNNTACPACGQLLTDRASQQCPSCGVPLPQGPDRPSLSQVLAD